MVLENMTTQEDGRSNIFPLPGTTLQTFYEARRLTCVIIKGIWNTDFHWLSIYFCFVDYAKAFDCVDHNKLWNILKEMELPDCLTCLLRNLYAGQEATDRTEHGTTDWFQIGKGVRQSCMLSPCLFNLYAEYIMESWNQDCWEKYQ